MAETNFTKTVTHLQRYHFQVFYLKLCFRLDFQLANLWRCRSFISHPKEGFSVFVGGQNSSRSVCFTACVAVRFSVVKLDNANQFSIASGPYQGFRITMT